VDRSAGLAWGKYPILTPASLADGFARGSGVRRHAGDARFSCRASRPSPRFPNPRGARTMHRFRNVCKVTAMNHDDDNDETEFDFDEADDDSVESQVWQLLRLINPGDDDMAMQQFVDYREAVADVAPEEVVPVEVIGRVIDWRSGFIVDEHDLRSLVQAIDELASRWNLTIDWNGDPDDDEFFDDIDAAGLFGIAYDRLAEFGYTLWAWETESDSHAGWMTLTRDNEPMRELATVLGINLRLGSEVG
jgi:hypothetical protein